MLLIFTLIALPISWAFRMPVGAPCNVTNSHMDINTKAFVSDCDSFGFCSTNGTCLPRQCRRDEFVMSSLLETGIPAPPMCEEGSFCPDDSSTCLPLVPLGGRCQLNRDDECAPPPAGQIYSIPSEWDQTVGNGAICLLGMCRWTNVTLGQPCTFENTNYIGYDDLGQSHSIEVTRDNCIEGEGYCDLSQTICLALKGLGEHCDADRECHTFNCGPTKTCLIPDEATIRVPAWVYAIVGLSLAAAMGIALYFLVTIHQRSEAVKRAALEGYYKEQTTYRNSILSFHSAMTGLSRQTTQESIDEKTPLTKAMSRSGSSMSSQTHFRRHGR